MRRLLAYVFMAVLVSISWKPVYADTIAVDFGPVTTTVSILNPAPLTLNGVTFSFDNQTFPLDTSVFASADSIGIYGGPGMDGALILDFASEVQGLSFNYENLGDGTLNPIDDAVAVLFFDGGAFTDAVLESGNLNQGGTFNYSGPAFNQAVVYFAVEADAFTADTFSYTPVAATPEPSSMLLLGTGIVGLSGLLRRRFLA